METPNIELHYGPYESHGIIRHKIQRLHGISEELTKLGYSIEFIPSIHLNRLTVVMKDREIFRCDIRNLLFNMDYMDDKVGHRLVAAVLEAQNRMYSDLNVPQYDSIKEGMRLLQKQRDATNLRDLLNSGTEVMFEIPLEMTRTKFTYTKHFDDSKMDLGTFLDEMSEHHEEIEQDEDAKSEDTLIN